MSLLRHTLSPAELDPSPSASFEDVVAGIVKANEGLGGFWSQAHGWVPARAAALLSASRLDWQVSLSRSLAHWSAATAHELDAHLILGWANLGALVEGTMKLYLSVFYEDYAQDIEALRDRAGPVVDPDVLTLEKLRQFFNKRQLWDETWNDWVLQVQQRRNAIHAYHDRPLGTLPELHEAIRTYLRFLVFVDSSLPYP